MDTTKEQPFISLVSDTTFKYLFKNNSIRPLLEEIIKEKTGINLKGYTFISEEDNTGNKTKDYRMDLVLEKDNNIVIIEMNREYSKTIEIKSRQYLYRVSRRSFDSGKKYLDEKKVKLIMFNNYYCRENKNVDVSHSYFCDNKNNIVYDDIEMHQIYIPIIKKVCYHKVNKVDKRLYLFTCTSYKEMDNIIDNNDDRKILDTLRRLNMDNAFLFDYDHEAVQKKIENSLREEGYEDGLKQNKIETARIMLKEGFDISMISKITKLTENDINNLK